MAGPFDDLTIEQRLSIVCRGTAYYLGQVGLTPDDEFGEPSNLPGWDIAHLTAHVGYNAKAVTNLVYWALTGEEKPMYSSPTARGEEINFGATLPPGAIRNLNDFHVIRLFKAWEKADGKAWEATVKTAQGRTVPMQETLWMRAREVWIHAVDLGKTARFSAMPDVFLRSLLPDIVGKWYSKGVGEGIVLVDDASGARWTVDDAVMPTTEVCGSVASLARWAAGRGFVGVHLAGTASGEVPAPPRWL
ncbi:MAG: maleylpyruvate isomerase family mycothiol-dependent enzyme [Corynebacterium pyruviciproducens]|uniref:maleylpyruvate isomerase family mycothiol-dependent enzyme n=1 Tax=Corynebacterium pyruviciproducens TaxID=598660 RepID=UPI0039834FF4